jgi:hypothetical protein
MNFMGSFMMVRQLIPSRGERLARFLMTKQGAPLQLCQREALF